MVKKILTIRFENVHFRFPTNSGASGLLCDVPCLANFSATLPLGHIVAVLPEQRTDLKSGGEGVMTILKLMTSQLYSNRGTVHVPPHMDTLLVHTEPMIICEPLMKNLRMGKPKADEAFVWKVAEALGMTKAVLGHGDMHLGNNGHSLRLADRQVVCLTRALIADPHILVLAKPCTVFSVRHAQQVMAVLSQWQRREGLWANGATSSIQDKILDTRTLIMSVPASSDVPDCVDLTAQVKRGQSATATLAIKTRSASASVPEVIEQQDYDEL
jgi:ABC-type transport system involved in cytochrome bd biosynthesis fused ATPase/permease subunit